MNKFIPAIAAVLTASSLWAVNGTIYTAAGDARTGEIKWQSRTKKFLLEYMKGKTAVTAEYTLEEVSKMNIPRPATLDKAIEMINAGQASGAIKSLEKIVTDYKMLTWDRPAGRYLVEAYLASNNLKKAGEIASQILADDKTAGYVGDFAPAYWRVLQKQGKDSMLEGLLKKAASSGDRASSAAALIMRGDIILSGVQETPEMLRKALTDAYLRVVLMYTDAACAQERKIALVKAADCLEKLGYASRGETLRAEAKK